MKQIQCEMCGGTDLVKEDGLFVCQSCGMKYSPEEAKKMMIEGTVNVQGTVKVDNSAFVEKYLSNARRALGKDDWEEVEKYYNMVEQNTKSNMEAVFFSAYGKAMMSLSEVTDVDQFNIRTQKFNVLNKSISVINEYYENTSEDKKAVLTKICEAVEKMFDIYHGKYLNTGYTGVTGTHFCGIVKTTKAAFLTELNQIAEKHNDKYIKELIERIEKCEAGSCYVATCVYGSYNCPEVWTLRRYRDDTLGSTWYGRAFIRIYYAVSPTLVRWFGHTNWFKNMWRGKLNHMVKKLQEKGVESTPYTDKNWSKK